MKRYALLGQEESFCTTACVVARQSSVASIRCETTQNKGSPIQSVLEDRKDLANAMFLPGEAFYCPTLVHTVCRSHILDHTSDFMHFMGLGWNSKISLSILTVMQQTIFGVLTTSAYDYLQAVRATGHTQREFHYPTKNAQNSMWQQDDLTISPGNTCEKTILIITRLARAMTKLIAAQRQDPILRPSPGSTSSLRLHSIFKANVWDKCDRLAVRILSAMAYTHSQQPQPKHYRIQGPGKNLHFLDHDKIVYCCITISVCQVCNPFKYTDFKNWFLFRKNIS